ncbi:MAG: T9SS type A sorting domain-containing protein, partial [Bacteroidales bacterium]
SSTGTYTVTATNASGCTDTETSAITVNPLPVASITPSGPTTFCEGGSVTLTASGGTGYLWSNAATTAAITVSSAGTYTVTATNESGCSDTETSSITVNPLPVAAITPNGPTTFCVGGSVSLTASGGTSYLWSNSATTAAITVSSSGTYTVTLSDENHCTDYNEILVDVMPLLQVSVTIVPSANPVITGEEMTFTAYGINGGEAPIFHWYVNGVVGNVISANSFTFIPSDNDEVVCVMTSGEPCTAGNPAVSNTVIVAVTGIPGSINLTGIIENSQNVCFNALHTIIVGGSATPFTVHEGGSVTMVAGENIIFLPGTNIEPGGYMHGYLAFNNQFCEPAVPSNAITIPAGTEAQRDTGNLTYTVFPNPTSGRFVILENREQHHEKVCIDVFNLKGESVFRTNYEGEKQHSFDFYDFPAGCYYIKVITEQKVELLKLIKSVHSQ